MESDFLIFRGTLFQSLVADTAKEHLPSVSRLKYGQIELKLAYLMVLLCCVLLIVKCSLR